MKNDVAFTVKGRRIILSEHQGTVNKNMPLRMLMYIAREYEKMMPVKARYLEQMQPLMVPSFLVFYNGEKDQPAEQVLKLSDAFPEPCGQNGKLELEVRVININAGKKHELLKNCDTLRQYSEFVEKTRKFSGDKNRLEIAVKECIKEGILADYLRRKSEEVVNMLMAEYDYETDIAVHSQEAEARGRAEGEIRGMVTVLYTKLNFSIKNISEELDIKEETVKKILFEKGLIENV